MERVGLKEDVPSTVVEDSTKRLFINHLSISSNLEGREGGERPCATVFHKLHSALLPDLSCTKTVRLWDAATGAALQTIEVDKAICRLSFDKEGPYLETDRGLLSIQPLYAGTFPLRAQPPCQIFVKETWVVLDMEKVLWLPSDYRATCVAVWNNILVFGHASGRVTFIHFSLS